MEIEGWVVGGGEVGVDLRGGGGAVGVAAAGDEVWVAGFGGGAVGGGRGKGPDDGF